MALCRMCCKSNNMLKQHQDQHASYYAGTAEKLLLNPTVVKEKVTGDDTF